MSKLKFQLLQDIDRMIDDYAEHKGLLREEIAERMQMSRSTLSATLLGDRKLSIDFIENSCYACERYFNVFMIDAVEESCNVVISSLVEFGNNEI